MLYVLAALARTVGHLSKSAEVMKLVNNLMKAPEMAATMQEFTKEITKVRSLKTLFGWLLETITPSDDPTFLSVEVGIISLAFFSFFFAVYLS